MRISTELSKQRGTSALEASLAVIPVLLVCLVGLELVHAHQSKHLVSLALQEAGRQASVTAADRHKVERAFALALSPLFTSVGRHATPQDRQQAISARYRRLYALPVWQLELTEVDVRDARSHEYRAVQLELLYLHEPLQSWLRKVLQQSARWLSVSPDGLTAKAQQQGLVVMRLSRRAVIHASAVQRTPNSWLKGTGQLQQQTLHKRQNLDSRLNDGLDSIAERPDLAKTSNLGLFQQESEQQGLCGVLLCCAQ
ncbi:MAG: hypothetical protein WCG12_03860 [Alcaligenaceae bacterium]